MLAAAEIVDSIRPLTRAEYERFVATGVFDDEAVELLEGVILRMPPPHGPEHDGTIHVIAKLLTGGLGTRAEVRIQSSFAASDRSQPEPDIAVVPPGDYRDAHPSTALLLVEVADTSLTRDRTTKADVYAASGVREYWIVDLVHRVIEVRTDPADGRYSTLTTKRRGDSISLVTHADVVIAVDDILR